MGKKYFDYHTIIIGAGVTGITLAKGLSKAKKRVLLIEQHLFGGAFIHTGCTPSKTLLFASVKDPSRALSTALSMVKELGNEYNEIALKNLGIHCLKAKASFINPHTLSCILDGGSVRNVTGKYIVIATGSEPKMIEGEVAKGTEMLTSETIFHLQEIPKELTIIGAGPLGIEMATAFSSMGSHVTVIAKSERILPKEDIEAAYHIQQKLEEKGVTFKLDQEIKNLEEVKAPHLFIAIGRKPCLSSLDLEGLGIFYNEQGIQTDRFGRTSQKNIFAAGDTTGPHFYTHLAKYEARIILKSLLYSPLLFSLKRKKAIPRVLFSSLELASIGLLESEAIELYGKEGVITHPLPFSQLPRALYENQREGFLKITTKKGRGKILGATALGPHAGEIIGFIASLMDKKVPLSKVGRLITPYPTYLDAVQEIADL